MEGNGDKSYRSNGTTSRQSHRPTQKRSLANYVDSIKEGLKKISGCQDVQEIAKPKRTIQDKEDTPITTHQLYFELPEICDTKSNKKSKDKRKRNNSLDKFENFHNNVPSLDSIKRTDVWIHHSDLSSTSRLSLGHLPIRGTLLPHRYDEYYHDDDDDNDDDVITQVSSCESARGTHGRGTPPFMDPKTPRLDQLFQQLQSKQEREARQQMIASGESHLLSFNLLDVYSHQVAGMPIGTTPEILPFMAAPLTLPSHNSNPFEIKHKKVSRLLMEREMSCRYSCKWSNCARQFDSGESLFTHVDQCHIQAYTNNAAISGRIVCKWDNCNRTYYARYKLLLHVHNYHCKETPLAAAGATRQHRQSQCLVQHRYSKLGGSKKKTGIKESDDDKFVWGEHHFPSKRKRKIRK